MGFALVIALTVVVSAFSILGVAKVNDSTKELATNWLPATRDLGQYRAAIGTIRRVAG